MGWTAYQIMWNYEALLNKHFWGKSEMSFYFYHDCNIWNLIFLLIQNYLEVFEKENKQLLERNFSFHVSTIYLITNQFQEALSF